MQSEKLEWQSEYIKYHNENPFVAPRDSYQETEIRLILEEVPEDCLHIIDFCCGTGRIATLLASEKRETLALDQSSGSLAEINNPDISPLCCVAQAAPIKGGWAVVYCSSRLFSIYHREHNVVLKGVEQTTERKWTVNYIHLLL